MFGVSLDSVFVYFASVHHRANYINYIFCVLALPFAAELALASQCQPILRDSRAQPGAHLSYANQPITNLQLQLTALPNSYTPRQLPPLS